MPVAVITRGDVERELLAELVADELGPVALVNNLPADYEGWLRRLFPEGLTDASDRVIPLAEHHHEFWRWVWAVEKGARPEPFVAIWPRGGGKSTSVELACVALGARRARRYVLYVCNTQAQADDHVQNIGALLESPAVEAAYPDMASRAVGKYGSSKGWRRNRLRTERGFVVDAIGLDTAARGVKLDDARPDLIVFDDVDDAADTPQTTQKKIVAITQKLLPAGSSDAAALAVQNLVHHEGVFARLAGLASEPADFLADRVVSGPHPAVRGLRVEKRPGNRWEIVQGMPTWEGQNLATCQRQINDWGIRAFRAEAQHEKQPPVGQAFPEWDRDVHICAPFDVPDRWPKWRGVDYGYAAPFCCLWMAQREDGVFFVYRELYGSGLTASEQALQVRALSAGETFKASVGDPAMWASSREGRQVQSVADQYREMGVPLTKAANERLAGKERVHQYLEWDEGQDGEPDHPPRLYVFPSCANLIRTLPMLPVDPHHPEDVDTDAEDHAYDALRYLLMKAASPRRFNGALAKALAPTAAEALITRMAPGVANVSERRREQDEQEARRRPVRRPGLLSGRGR